MNVDCVMRWTGGLVVEWNDDRNDEKMILQTNYLAKGPELSFEELEYFRLLHLRNVDILFSFEKCWMALGLREKSILQNTFAFLVLFLICR